MDKQRQDITHFILRTLVALLPVVLLVISYVISDPFEVVHRYSGQAVTVGDTVQPNPNGHYIAWEGFQYYHPSQQFNAFILGSSISKPFMAAAWARYLPDSARIYHFTASGETLIGIRDLLQRLTTDGVTLSHVLVVMETDMLRRATHNDQKPLILHPEVSPSVSWWQFHRVFFNAFRDPDYFIYAMHPSKATIDHLIAHAKITRVMQSIRNDTLNENYNTHLDSLIESEGLSYFDRPGRRWLINMHVRPEPQSLAIDPNVERVLREIAHLLSTHCPDYRIIVPPCYRKPALAALDHHMLCEIMGDEHVFDFSNDSDLVLDLTNYYDGSHITTRCCNTLLDRAYQQDSLLRLWQLTKPTH